MRQIELPPMSAKPERVTWAHALAVSVVLQDTLVANKGFAGRILADA